jgi:hypothetical protein
MFVCVCVRARVGARARGRVALLIHLATRMLHMFFAGGSLPPPHYTTLSNKRHDFQKKSY